MASAGIMNICCRRKKCKKAIVLSQSPPQDGASADTALVTSITFNRKVKVNSFTLSIQLFPGSIPNVPGSFVYNPATRTATFTAAPPILGESGVVTATVVIDQGTKCAQTIVWTYEWDP